MRTFSLLAHRHTKPPTDLMGFFIWSKMTYTKYKASFSWPYKITPTEVQSETEKFLTLANGRREAKKAEYWLYCDTHNEALQVICASLSDSIHDAARNLAYRENELSQFKQKHNIQ